MPKNKKPPKFKNTLESLDSFVVDHNFKYTNKEAKGTVVGFVFSVIFNNFLLVLRFLLVPLLFLLVMMFPCVVC